MVPNRKPNDEQSIREAPVGGKKPSRIVQARHGKESFAAAGAKGGGTLRQKNGARFYPEMGRNLADGENGPEVYETLDKKDGEVTHQSIDRSSRQGEGADESNPAEVAVSSISRGTTADMDWYISNLHRLVEQYPDHWLAILNQQIVAAAPNTRQLRDRLDELGIPRAFVGRSHPEVLIGVR